MHSTRSGNRMSPTQNLWPEWMERGCTTVYSGNGLRRIIHYEEIWTPNLSQTSWHPQGRDVHHLWHLSNQRVRPDASCNLWVRPDPYQQSWEQWEVDVRLIRQINPWVKCIFEMLGHTSDITTPKTLFLLVTGSLFYPHEKGSDKGDSVVF